MKKIIESLFNFIFTQPEDLKEDEKTPIWQMALILVIIGLMVLVLYLAEK